MSAHSCIHVKEVDKAVKNPLLWITVMVMYSTHISILKVLQENPRKKICKAIKRSQKITFLLVYLYGNVHTFDREVASFSPAIVLFTRKSFPIMLTSQVNIPLQRTQKIRIDFCFSLSHLGYFWYSFNLKRPMCRRVGYIWHYWVPACQYLTS